MCQANSKSRKLNEQMAENENLVYVLWKCKQAELYVFYLIGGFWMTTNHDNNNEVVLGLP